MPRLKGQKSSSSWPATDLEALSKLWSEGKTAAQIATRLPYSRSAICAMARRQGLEPRPRAVPLAKKFDRLIALVAEDDLSLPAAAKQVCMTITEARDRWQRMLDRYDFGEPQTFSDDDQHGPMRV